jgi:Alw26I/Eco31I/Esp3I family type II restriction endonuclease
MGKEVHINFKKYQKKFVTSITENDYPYEVSSEGEINWYAMKNTPYGEKMIAWADTKINQLGIENKPGKYQKLMSRMHPFKEKPCHVCGNYMSIDYVYLNKNTVKKIQKKLDLKINELTSIYELFKNNENHTDRLIEIFEFNAEKDINSEIQRLIEECKDGKKTLGPGVMSNFPDRIDGYHTYNRCCRSKEDKGRHADNLRSYSKDRRAYEYWSEGNLHAANQYMASSRFKNTSADHIGPISLGFKHESIFLQPLESSYNSSKRDRLIKEDILKLIEIEVSRRISPVSFHCYVLWEELKKTKLTEKNLEIFRDYFKQNQIFYYFVLYEILGKKNGKDFLIETFLKPKIIDFRYDYTFDDMGQIIKTTPRKINDANKKEFKRLVEVSLQSLIDFSEKDNRKVKVQYSVPIKVELDKIFNKIKMKNYPEAKELILKVMNMHQNNLIT